MKTLYLSDLDGTLLNSNAKISDYSAKIINRFIQSGGCFSYATARSFVTASKVTLNLNTSSPVICYNGAFILESGTNKMLLSNYFTEDEVGFIADTLCSHDVYPIVHAYVNGVERFSYVAEKITPAMKHFLDSRIGDPRHRTVECTDDLYCGDVFYIACMDTDSLLSKVNDIFSANKSYNCIYHKDIYSSEPWCEVMPVMASKANAAVQLKNYLGCEKLIAFGEFFYIRMCMLI